MQIQINKAFHKAISKSMNRTDDVKVCLNIFICRNMNEPCMYMDFFDNHDMWHFFSATALFLAFIFLLTIDDDLLLEERKNIKVF